MPEPTNANPNQNRKRRRSLPEPTNLTGTGSKMAAPLLDPDSAGTGERIQDGRIGNADEREPYRYQNNANPRCRNRWAQTLGTGNANDGGTLTGSRQ